MELRQGPPAPRVMSHSHSLGFSERQSGPNPLPPAPMIHLHSNRHWARLPSAAAECGWEMTDYGDPRAGGKGVEGQPWRAALHVTVSTLQLPSCSRSQSRTWGFHMADGTGFRCLDCPGTGEMKGWPLADFSLVPRAEAGESGPLPHSTAPAHPQAFYVTCLAKVKGQRQLGRRSACLAMGCSGVRVGPHSQPDGGRETPLGPVCAPCSLTIAPEGKLLSQGRAQAQDVLRPSWWGLQGTWLLLPKTGSQAGSPVLLRGGRWRKCKA